MQERSKPSQIGITLLAILLWLISFILGLQSIYSLIQLYFLIKALLGGGEVQIDPPSTLVIAFLLGLIFLVFIVASTEYHWKHLGVRRSWLLFAWSIAVEVSIIILYYIL